MLFCRQEMSDCVDLEGSGLCLLGCSFSYMVFFGVQFLCMYKLVLDYTVRVSYSFSYNLYWFYDIGFILLLSYLLGTYISSSIRFVLMVIVCNFKPTIHDCCDF